MFHDWMYQRAFLILDDRGPTRKIRVAKEGRGRLGLGPGLDTGRYVAGL